MGSHVNPPLSYAEALAKLDAVALSQKSRHAVVVESLPLEQAVGRVAAGHHLSPGSTPRHDTSAMDGFAIRSKDTAMASPENPARFRVRPETVAAGDDPGLMRGHTVGDGDDDSEELICVEITTGGIFPAGFDSCVRFEDTEDEIPPALSPPHCVGPTERQRHILVRKPIPSSANRRFAGSDLHKGQMLLRKGESITLAHVLPLAAAGYTRIAVTRRPRIAIVSTGNELLSQKSQVSPEHDINGPYLTAAATSFGLEAEFLGTAADSASSLGHALQTAMHSTKDYDVVVTSGGVSRGRYDLVRPVLGDLEAEIVFHGLAIRPGHPVLFALLPPMGEEGVRTAFFGLPGNPGASAACFRFLVVPYLMALSGQGRETAFRAKLERGSEAKPGCGRNMDWFCHGWAAQDEDGLLVVQTSKEQSPAKMGPYCKVNCWVHHREEDGGREGPDGMVDCYPFSPKEDPPWV